MQVRPYTAEDHADLARLCWAYRALLQDRSTGIDDLVETYYAEDDYRRLIEDLPRIHARPKGEILMAEHDGQVIGCGMYYPLDLPATCEIKRVFVAPEGRGLGAGRALMMAGIKGARADGYRRMLLDTMVHLTEAIGLYESLGFAPGSPFYDLDPRFAHVIRFFELDLT